MLFNPPPTEARWLQEPRAAQERNMYRIPRNPRGILSLRKCGFHKENPCQSLLCPILLLYLIYSCPCGSGIGRWRITTCPSQSQEGCPLTGRSSMDRQPEKGVIDALCPALITPARIGISAFQNLSNPLGLLSRCRYARVRTCCRTNVPK